LQEAKKMKFQNSLRLSFVTLTLALLILAVGATSAQAHERSNIPGEMSATLHVRGASYALSFRLSAPESDRQSGSVTWPDGRTYPASARHIYSARPELVFEGQQGTYGFVVPDYGAPTTTSTLLSDTPIVNICEQIDCTEIIVVTERWWKEGRLVRLEF
jgi:hypothetical protein